MRIEGVRGQILAGIHGIFAERDVVAEVQAHAHPLAAQPFHPRRLFGRTPALVVLDREPHLVLAQNRLRQLHGRLVALEAGLEAGEVVEFLVAPRRHGGVQRDRSQILRSLHLSVERRNPVGIVGETRIAHQVHVVALDLRAVLLHRLRIGSRHVRHLHAAQPEAVQVIRQVERLAASTSRGRVHSKCRRRATHARTARRGGGGRG